MSAAAAGHEGFATQIVKVSFKILMQLQININFNGRLEKFLFNLIDNPGVAAWAEHCKKISSKRNVVLQHVPPIQIPGSLINTKLWQAQQTVQNALSKTQYALPLPVTKPNEITQHHLNTWHRWFTENTKMFIRQKTVPTEINLLRELNDVVHSLEHYVQEWPASALTISGCELNFFPDYLRHEFVDLEQYREYHSWEPADLILDQAIHGKSTMQSFIDNDDPRHWDTTGHYISFGGCKLVKESYRQKIYGSELFNQWTTNYDVHPRSLWPDYPLGNLATSDRHRLDDLFLEIDTQNTLVDFVFLD